MADTRNAEQKCRSLAVTINVWLQNYSPREDNLVSLSGSVKKENLLTLRRLSTFTLDLE